MPTLDRPRPTTTRSNPRSRLGRDEASGSRAATLADLTAPLVVAALLYVGFFKRLESLRFLPVDLTLVCLLAVFVGVVYSCVGRREQLRLPLPAAAFVALLLPATLYTVTNPEAIDKRLKMVIPLLAVVGVATLVRSARRQRIWVWLHVLIGIALVGTSVGAGDSTERFGAAGSNTIAAGRASGVAVVVLLILILTPGGLRRWWMKLAALGATVWLAEALISTGSRGPVLACAASVLIVAAGSPGRGRLIRAVGGVAAVGAGWLLLTDATGIGATRITRSLEGRYSLTASREGLWSEALSAIPGHPLGIGWGNFWALLRPSSRLDSGYVQYPHNFVLEIFVEAGWLAGVATVVLVVLSLQRLRQSSTEPYGAALFGIAVFFVLNALVSGDLNDNRMMWAAVAMAWVSAQAVGGSFDPAADAVPGTRARTPERGPVGSRRGGVGDQAELREGRDQRPQRRVASA
jgi:O-antigen ligase